MSLLHPALLAGLGLAAIPVVLHLLMRPKPRKLVFPALRLIQNRRRQHVRRLRLRHLWLLLLRVLVIGLLVLAVARPSVPAADYSLRGHEVATLLVLIVAAVAGSYVVERRWRAARLPRHELRSRSARLRWGAGLATLLLLLVAVAWPYQRRVAAQLRDPAPVGDITLPVAGVFLFDTSLSMEYQQEGRTRLEAARAIAIAHLSDLPRGSRIAVADTSNDHPILFQSTLSGAKVRLESLELKPLSGSLNDRIREAVRLQQDDRQRTLQEQSAVAADQRTDRALRRVYVFTDLARSAWRVGGSSRLEAELEAAPSVRVYLIDVGEQAPRNAGLVHVEPEFTQVTTGQTVRVRAEILGTGLPPGEQRVELLLRQGTGKPIKVDERTLPVEGDRAERVEFVLPPAETGPIIHGEVRLVSSDPLPFDDRRAFTLGVTPAIRVLVIADREEDVQEWNVALEVKGYKPVVKPAQSLQQLDPSSFDVVCLLNVTSLPDEGWYRLGKFIEGGGGLVVFLGDQRLDPVNYNRDEAQVFLPGTLDVHTAPGVQFLKVLRAQHPLFRPLEHDEGIELLESAEVYRFWRVEPAGTTAVLARYTDEQGTPSLLERSHGQGRVLMFTTAVDVKGHRREWNLIASPQGPVWTFLTLADQFVRYLARNADAVYTYQAGETPILPLGAADSERSFLLQHPGFRQSRVVLPAAEPHLAVSGADELGSYDLRTAGERPAVVSGFSLNAPRGESEFTRIEADELNQILGEDRYQIAASIDELHDDINLADVGWELFPIVLTAACLFFVGEHLVANRFYGDDGDVAAVLPTRTGGTVSIPARGAPSRGDRPAPPSRTGPSPPAVQAVSPEEGDAA
jgi:hypothetical protein